MLHSFVRIYVYVCICVYVYASICAYAKYTAPLYKAGCIRGDVTRVCIRRDVTQRERETDRGT